MINSPSQNQRKKNRRTNYRALHTTSPGILNCSASLASNHWCSLSAVLTIATSPIPSGFTCPLLLPEQIILIPCISKITLLLGLLMSSMALNTGWSSRYLSSAHMRRSDSFAALKSDGEGPATVPRVMEEMNPARRRMERMPRV